MPHYARTLPAPATEADWEPLDVHLKAVAARAADFARAFDAADWGRLAGLWHDVGKYRPEFQARLRDPSIHAPHAGVGAALAVELPPIGFAVAGHHAGLANREKEEHGPTPLKKTVEKYRLVLEAIRGVVPASILAGARPDYPAWITMPRPAAEADAECVRWSSSCGCCSRRWWTPTG